MVGPRLVGSIGQGELGQNTANQEIRSFRGMEEWCRPPFMKPGIKNGLNSGCPHVAHAT